MGIAEFVTARLDEDEQLARELLEAWPDADDRWPPPALERYRDEPMLPWSRGIVPFVVAWHPARVLREVAAKRAIIEDYQIITANAAIEQANGDKVNAGAYALAAKSLRMALVRLAMSYADHPDYEQALAAA